ncbi:GNAT family N-acetyltransferase [Streptomyces sp. NPDC051310]|uniref:GNAT family N-acetyltransferase n=1 Tax=Streptomyces sp. NPDC051310 TaxID=3365649 RepID=UPI00379E8588
MSFDVTVCRDGEEFGRLAGEWAGLHRGCAAATPFQAHSWLHSWWTSYGTPGRLRVVLVRRGGRLVAAAPLRLVPGPVPVLTPLGGAITDFSDVLVDDACEEAVAALTRALGELARSAVIDLREVRAGAVAERVWAQWRGPRHRLADSVCLDLPPLPIDGLVGRLPRARAQRARAKLRRIENAGVEERVVPPVEIPQALERLLELHRRQWEGRRVTSEHLTRRFAEHLQRAVRPMAESGNAMVTEFRIAGDVVAANITLMSPRLSGAYLYGADPALRTGKVDVLAMLLRTCAQECSTNGRATLSLLRGTEPYKRQWRPSPARNQRLLMSRRRMAPALLLRAAYAGGRARAARTVRAVRERRAGGGG